MINDNGVAYYSIECVDVVKTSKNGRQICYEYRPLVEKRIKQILATPMNSTSVVIFSGNKSERNDFEKKLIDRCGWNDDQITNFINNILILEKHDYPLGKFLKDKYIYDKMDEEIAKDLKITERTLLNYKAKAYFKVAIWSNKVEFIKCKNIHFEEK